MIARIEQRREQMVSSARTVTFPGPVSFQSTLFPLRRGPGDPCFRIDADGAIWRTSLVGSGSVTARISRTAADAVGCTAWGSGAQEFLDALLEHRGDQRLEHLIGAAQSQMRHPPIRLHDNRVDRLET